MAGGPKGSTGALPHVVGAQRQANIPSSRSSSLFQAIFYGVTLDCPQAAMFRTVMG
jgi:hypothetical protein